MRFALRLGAFAFLTTVLYALMLGVLALVEFRGRPLFEGLTRTVLRPVAGENTAPRIAELDRLVSEGAPLDVLFVGSSLTYRGIDARHFAPAGVEVFALGLSSATPLNHAPLLVEVVPRLRPALVALEAHPDLLRGDGTEALYAFAVTQPLGARTLRMAARVRSVQALNLVGALGWYRLANPLGSEAPLPPDDPTERYAGAGFTGRAGTLSPAALERSLQHLPVRQPLSTRQLAALRRNVETARQAGSRVAFVAPPVHPAHLAWRPALAAQADTLRALARDLDVPYLDFTRLPLRPLADFQDLTHLSAEGVARYNRALLDTLRARHLLDPHR